MLPSIRHCSLPSPSLKPACSGVELPAQSFCHAYCWNLPLCCSEPCTWSPCYWTPRLIGGNWAPFPFLIIACGTVKLSFDQNACLSCIIFSRRLALLLFQVSKMPFQPRTQTCDLFFFLFLKKYLAVAGRWWCMPLIPALRRHEAGKPL